MPITRTTSPSSRGRVAAARRAAPRRAERAPRAPRRRGGASPRGRPSARSPGAGRRGSRRRRARGRAATRARPRPGVARVRVARPRPAAVGARGRPARRGPPSGECAITAIPASSQRSTTPPRSARSSNGLSATWTAATGASSSASSSWRRLTFATPDVPHEPVVDEPRQRAHRRSPRRPRIGRVDEVEVDRQAVERGEARLAVGADRLRAAVRDPRAARRASCRPSSRSRAVASAPQAREQRGPAAARCRRTSARCRRPSRPRRPPPRSSRGRAPRRGPRPSTAACSRGRCGAPRRQAIQGGSGESAYGTRRNGPGSGGVIELCTGSSRCCSWCRSRRRRPRPLHPSAAGGGR